MLQSVTRYMVSQDVIGCYRILHGTCCHRVSQDVTGFCGGVAHRHSVPQGVVRCYTVHGVTRCHMVLHGSRCFTDSRGVTVSQGVTECHRVSHGKSAFVYVFWFGSDNQWIDSQSKFQMFTLYSGHHTPGLGGAHPIMGRFRPKGVPFSRSRYMKG